MDKITVIDSMMGTGKTSWMIKYLQNNSHIKFIYVAQYIDEVQRIISCVPNSFEPIYSNQKNKSEHFIQLIKSGASIVTTHELFKRLDLQTKSLIKHIGYILILDEVIDVVSQYKISGKDIEYLLKSNAIKINDYGILNWIDEEYYQFDDTDYRFSDIKRYSELSQLIYINNSVLFWQYPPQIFDSFNHIYILTYLFKYQPQKYYFDLYKLSYNFKSIIKYDNEYHMVEYYHSDLNKYKSLINICEHKKLNEIGDKPTALSKAWFSNSYYSDDQIKLKKNIHNYISNILNCKSTDLIWTIYKEDNDGDELINSFKGVKHSKYNFLPMNKRSTNDYRDRTVAIYAVNRFMNPIIKNNFFGTFDMQINEDGYALCDMIQWIWRTSIRNGNKINVYLPSKRMREIYYKWLNNEL